MKGRAKIVTKEIVNYLICLNPFVIINMNPIPNNKKYGPNLKI